MLRSISWTQFQEWQTFSELEPFGEERQDYRMAAIEAALWNIARDTKRNPKGWSVSEFLLGFGDLVRPTPTAPVVQSLATQELLLDTWIIGSNLVYAREHPNEVSSGN